MTYDAIPEELRQLNAWVVWRWEPDPDKPNEPRKPPYRASDPAAKASSTDPRTWARFDRAAAVVDIGQADGIGFALSSPYVGVDLDEELSTSERYSIMTALDSYSEVSPSGKGHHVIVRATLNDKGHHPKGIGVFQRERFFYTTGLVVDGMRGTIEDRQAEIDALVAEYVPSANGSTVGVVPTIEPVMPDTAPAHLLARLDETPADRSAQSFAFIRDCIRSGLPDAAVMALALKHQPTKQKYGSRAAAEIARSIRKARASLPEPRLSLRRLDTYDIRRVEWLDKPFLQRSAFHLWAGRKGSCKGTVMCGIAARASRGELYEQPKRVLVVTSEDSVEIDFKPRVIAAGGDDTRIEIVNGPFRMPADLPWVRQTAERLGDVGLIVIDPIGNHLGGADTDKEGLVREAISPLNPMADELDCMIIGVRHLGKDVSRGALASVLGSTAWVDVPRCVILMARDDEDDNLFHAQVVAGNRGPRNHGRAFRLELIDVPPATEITLAIPDGDSHKDVEQLLGNKSDTSPSRSMAARDLILDVLEQDSEQESDTLDARVAQATGLAAKTIKNLRTKLKNEGLIKVLPQKDTAGEILYWIVSRTQAPRP